MSCLLCLLYYSPTGLPIYHSKPDAPNTIYLDFDGHINPAYSGWGAFDAPGYSFDDNDAAFSSAERSAIGLVWARVAEDYAPFDVDVTTEEPPDMINPTVLHCAIISARDRKGNAVPYSAGGGVAYLDVFGTPSEYLRPALVFWDNLGDGSSDYVVRCMLVFVSADSYFSLCAMDATQWQ